MNVPDGDGGPGHWEPNGYATGVKIGEAVNTGSKIFAGAMAGMAAQRHYQETGDWRTAAVAGGRGFIRWILFFWTCFHFLYWLGAVVLTPVLMNTYMHAPERQGQQAGVFFHPIASKENTLALIPIMLGGPIMTLFAAPYGLGVLWMRYSDRSLFRVNHRWIYRWLEPFAYRMRNVPDAMLWFAAPLCWTIGMFGGSLIGKLIVA